MKYDKQSRTSGGGGGGVGKKSNMKSTTTNSPTEYSDSYNDDTMNNSRIGSSSTQQQQQVQQQRQSQKTTLPPSAFIASNNSNNSNTSRNNSNTKNRRGLYCGCLFLVLVIGVIVAVVYYTVIQKNNDKTLDSLNNDIWNITKRNSTDTDSDTGATSGNNNSSNTNTTVGTDSTTTGGSGTSTTDSDDGQQKCNGHTSLCTVPANKVYYATVHNAMSTVEDGVIFLPNHSKNLENALNAGYRGINLDIGKCKIDNDNNNNDTTISIQFFHSSCSYGIGRNAKETMISILQYLTNNSNEVIIISLQIENSDTSTSSGGTISLDEISTLFQSIPNLQNMLYQHTDNNTIDNWPTLGTLIQQNTRIILMHYNANEKCVTSTSTSNSTDAIVDTASTSTTTICPPGFHEYFYYVSETQFEFTTIQQYTTNVSYSCQLTRGIVQPKSISNFIGINIFISIPSKNNAIIMNNFTYIQQHITKCIQYYKYRIPNILLVDYWDIGTVLDIVQYYNELL